MARGLIRQCSGAVKAPSTRTVYRHSFPQGLLGGSFDHRLPGWPFVRDRRGTKSRSQRPRTARTRTTHRGLPRGRSMDHSSAGPPHLIEMPFPIWRMFGCTWELLTTGTRGAGRSRNLCRCSLRAPRPLRLGGVLHGISSLDDGTKRGVHRVRAAKARKQLRLDDRNREGPARLLGVLAPWKPLGLREVDLRDLPQRALRRFSLVPRRLVVRASWLVGY